MTTPTPPTEKCCEKCVEKGDFRGEIYHIDPDCPCHTTDTGLENRLMQVFPYESLCCNGDYCEARCDEKTRNQILGLIQHIAKEEYERGFNQGHAQSAAECKCCDGCKESYERGRKDAVEFLDRRIVAFQNVEIEDLNGRYVEDATVEDFKELLEAALETQP